MPSTRIRACSPSSTEQMRRDFATEIELFLASVLLEDRSVVQSC